MVMLPQKRLAAGLGSGLVALRTQFSRGWFSVISVVLVVALYNHSNALCITTDSYSKAGTSW